METPASRAAPISPMGVLAEMRRIMATPEYRRASERLDWLVGPGACVPEARHRLILSGGGLGGVAAAAALVAVIVRRRR
jgi:hypothetical protein